jgi:hypothetical protein
MEMANKGQLAKLTVLMGRMKMSGLFSGVRPNNALTSSKLGFFDRNLDIQGNPKSARIEAMKISVPTNDKFSRNGPAGDLAILARAGFFADSSKEKARSQQIDALDLAVSAPAPAPAPRMG